MANRYHFDMQSRDRETKVLYALVDVGAVGAPTLRTNNNNGIASITRNATGDYDVVLEDNWFVILGFRGSLLVDSPEDIVFQLGVEDVGSGTLSFFTQAGALAADPSDGSVMLLEITVKNSSIK